MLSANPARMTTLMRSRWATTGNRRAVASIPKQAPMTVPRLKNPCMVGMTDRTSKRSTSAPSTFSATSPPPMPSPKSASPNATSTPLPAITPKPTTPTPAAIDSMPATMIGRVPSRETSGPELRIPIMDPTDSPNRMSPI